MSETDFLTGKCRNCGDTRKGHKPNGKCRTQLKDTKFEPWTDDDRADVGIERLAQPGTIPSLPTAYSVNRALRSGVKCVYGILPGTAPGGGKRRVFGYRKVRRSSYAEGQLQNGSWVQLISVEIEPS